MPGMSACPLMFAAIKNGQLLAGHLGYGVAMLVPA